ncbi:unnamed protein product [Prunus brigantina]
MDLTENCPDQLPIFDWCKRLEFLKGASASLCLSTREFSKTLLLSSRQIIRIRTILLSSLDILGKGQTTAFLPDTRSAATNGHNHSNHLRSPITTNRGRERRKIEG